MNTERNQIISESDLINGCLEEDRRMQEELYRRFSPRMYGICLRYAGNAAEAEDILQEGFIKVYKKLNTYRREGSFEGWVRRIFVNTAIEHFRRKVYQHNRAFGKLRGGKLFTICKPYLEWSYFGADRILRKRTACQ